MIEVVGDFEFNFFFNTLRIFIFYVAPAPASTITVLATKCIDKSHNKSAWFVPWPNATKCRSLSSFDQKEDLKIIEEEGISANDIVFAFKFPLPRDNRELHMSRWFQSIIGILQVDNEYSEDMTIDFGKHTLL